MTSNPLARQNHRGQIIDRYGRKTVYEGRATSREERYLVWYGSHSGGRFTGLRKTYSSLYRAIRAARRMERLGYDTRITDRLEGGE